MSSPAERVWYVAGQENQPIGPFTAGEIIADLRSGSLSDRTLCWREGMPEWAPLAQVLTLFEQETMVVGGEPRVRQSPPAIDLRVEGYEVLSILGAGGMGTVYVARQVSLDRRVAIKVLAPVLAKDPDFVARFEREVAALVRLSHPHIVTIFDQGRSPTGEVYYVMEYVEGEGGGPAKDLQQHIAERSLDSEKTRRLVLQVVQALGFAHREGIIHRDVKPSNVLVDRHGFAKVADFGIACIRGGAGARHVTVANASVGTGLYMSPEQHQDAASVDHRTDIYSTGVMLYQMLTGELPLAGYEPPSAVVPGLNPAWDAIVARALQPRPENRFCDMAEFEQALTGLQATPGVTSQTRAAGGTSARQPTPTLSSTLHCPSCGVPVAEEGAFCAQCGAPVWLRCRGCGERVFAAARFCPRCRADLESVRRFEQGARSGKAHLEKAKGSAPPLDRLRSLQQARGALGEALGQIEDPEIRALLAEAETLTAQWAWEAGENAVQARRLTEASYCFEQLLEVSPDHAAGAARLKQLRDLRAALIAKAQSAFQQGDFKGAIDLLTRAAQSFRGDPEIAGLLAQYGEKTQFAAEMQAKIAALARENKWCEVSQLIAELQQSGVPVQGLEQFAANVRERLARVEPLLAAARSSLERGDTADALAKAQQVLEHVADHVEAMEIVELARNQRPPSRLGRRLAAAAAALVLVVLLGVGGYFELDQRSSLREEGRRATQGKNEEDFRNAVDSLATFASRPYHRMIGRFFHGYRVDYYRAVAQLKGYACGGDETGLTRAAKELERLFAVDAQWRAEAKQDLADTLALASPGGGDVRSKRRFTVAKKLDELKVADPKRLAAAVLKGVGKLSAEDRELVWQVLTWDLSVEQTIAVEQVLPTEPAERTRLLQQWAGKKPSPNVPLAAGLLKCAERCVSGHDYSNAVKWVNCTKMLKDADPSYTEDLGKWLEGQVDGVRRSAGSGPKDWDGAVTLLDLMAAIDPTERAGERAAQLYQRLQETVKNSAEHAGHKLREPCAAILVLLQGAGQIENARKLVGDAETAFTSRQWNGAVEKSEGAIKALSSDTATSGGEANELRQRAETVRRRAQTRLDLEEAKKAFDKGDLPGAKKAVQGVRGEATTDKDIQEGAEKLIRQLVGKYKVEANKALSAARAELTKGEFRTAGKELKNAEQAHIEAAELLPNDPELESLKGEIEEVRARGVKMQNQKKIAQHLAAAKDLATKRDWPAALEEVRLALTIQPNHAEAQELEKQYQKCQEDPKTTNLSGRWKSEVGTVTLEEVVDANKTVSTLTIKPLPGTQLQLGPVPPSSRGNRQPGLPGFQPGPPGFGGPRNDMVALKTSHLTRTETMLSGDLDVSYPNGMIATVGVRGAVKSEKVLSLSVNTIHFLQGNPINQQRLEGLGFVEWRKQ